MDVLQPAFIGKNHQEVLQIPSLEILLNNKFIY